MNMFRIVSTALGYVKKVKYMDIGRQATIIFPKFTRFFFISMYFKHSHPKIMKAVIEDIKRERADPTISRRGINISEDIIRTVVTM